MEKRRERKGGESSSLLPSGGKNGKSFEKDPELLQEDLWLASYREKRGREIPNVREVGGGRTLATVTSKF